MKTLGQIAYEGYCEASEGKSLISGQPLPVWDSQGEEIKNAWQHVGACVSEYLASEKDRPGGDE